MDVRPPQAGDASALQAFFRRMPEGDLTFFKEDVLNEDVIASWVGPHAAGRWLALDGDGDVIGYLAVLPHHGWSSHVGELRLVVDPAHRRRGIGRELARRGLVEALNAGLTKVVVEVVADQDAAISMFTGLGFEAEALLRDHVCDRAGHFRDLIVLAHHVPEMSSAMSTLGIDDALGQE